MEYEIKNNEKSDIFDWKNQTKKGNKITIKVRNIYLSKSEEYIVADTSENSTAFFPTNVREFEYKGEIIVDNSKPTGLRYLTAIMAEINVNKVDDVAEFLRDFAPHSLTIDHQEKGRLFTVKDVGFFANVDEDGIEIGEKGVESSQ